MESSPPDALEGCKYYITLYNGEFRVKQGDCVYLERIQAQFRDEHKKKNESCNSVERSDVDVFRVERLYIDSGGKKFVYGHHYLRPSETYHEPSRKFFPNEVLKSPLAGSAPLESVKGACWVLDSQTYCKGRPKGAREEDIYICDFRVDKSARFFNRVSKHQYPVCTKAYAFDVFEHKIAPKRTYSVINDIHVIVIISRINDCVVFSLIYTASQYSRSIPKMCRSKAKISQRKAPAEE